MSRSRPQRGRIDRSARRQRPSDRVGHGRKVAGRAQGQAYAGRASRTGRFRTAPPYGPFPGLGEGIAVMLLDGRRGLIEACNNESELHQKLCESLRRATAGKAIEQRLFALSASASKSGFLTEVLVRVRPGAPAPKSRRDSVLARVSSYPSRTKRASVRLKTFDSFGAFDSGRDRRPDLRLALGGPTLADLATERRRWACGQGWPRT
jgi:hypothetical protein